MLGIWASFVQTFFEFDSPVFLWIVNKNTFASVTDRQTVIYWDRACLSFSGILDVKIYKHFTYPSNVYKNHFYFILVHLPSNMICYNILAWTLIHHISVKLCYLLDGSNIVAKEDWTQSHKEYILLTVSGIIPVFTLM